MEETVFLDKAGASITSNKIVIGTGTYATRNVGSVRVEKVARPWWPWLMIFLGAVSAFTMPPLGLLLLGFGALMVWMKQPKSKLILLAGGGETMAFESKDVKFVEEVHQAIISAISSR